MDFKISQSIKISLFAARFYKKETHKKDIIYFRQMLNWIQCG
jgi:hypothetical protein